VELLLLIVSLVPVTESKPQLVSVQMVSMMMVITVTVNHV